MNDDIKKLYDVSFLAKSESGAAVVVSHLIRFGGEIMEEGSPKKMNLAYPIKTEKSAFFSSIKCKLGADSVASVRDAMKLDKDVLRIFITEPNTIGEKNEGQSFRRVSEKSHTATTQTQPKRETRDDGIVSNELLEEKLEEILQ